MRTFTSFAVLACVGGALAFAAPAAADEPTTIVVNGSGGGLAKIIDKVFDKPFTQRTGIRVKSTASTNPVAKLKAMMQTGNIEWDVTETGPEGFPLAAKNGWLEPIDWAYLDPEGALPAFVKKKYGVPAASYSTILTVRTDKLPPGKRMTGWVDFWDVKTFPGPRALRNEPTHNLEFALLADGVAKEDLYKVLSTKEGVDRAFRKLDEIKPHIVTWWKAGAQPVQLLADGEVYYTSAWNGRIAVLAKQGTPVEIVWNGGGLNIAYYAIPKGAKHVKEAHEYLKFTLLDPDRSADFVKMIPYPTFAPGLYDRLPKELGEQLPTHPNNLGVQYAFDASWWAERLDELQERWNAWLLE